MVETKKTYHPPGDIPSLSSSEMTNPRKAVFIVCKSFTEVHIRDLRNGKLYRIIPQKGSKRAVQVALSVVENGHFVAGRVKKVSPYHDYGIGETQIKINVAASGRGDFGFLVEAPENWEVVREPQPLSTEKFY